MTARGTSSCAACGKLIMRGNPITQTNNGWMHTKCFLAINGMYVPAKFRNIA